MIFLDLALLVMPVILMIVAYGRIALKLVHGFRQMNDNSHSRRECPTLSLCRNLWR